MKKFVVAVALILLAAHQAFAASRKSATLECDGLSNVPILSFYLDITDGDDTSSTGGRDGAQFMSITTELSEFPSFLQLQAAGKHLASCYVVQTGQQQTQSLRFIEVYAVATSITADAKSQYATVVFDFSKVEIPATIGASVTQTSTPLTAEQRHKALAEFMARVPKPTVD